MGQLHGRAVFQDLAGTELADREAKLRELQASATEAVAHLELFVDERLAARPSDSIR